MEPKNNLAELMQGGKREFNVKFKWLEQNMWALPFRLTPDNLPRLLAFCELVREENPEVIFISEIWQIQLLEVLKNELSGEYDIYYPAAEDIKGPNFAFMGFHHIGSAFLVRKSDRIKLTAPARFVQFPVRYGQFIEEIFARKGFGDFLLEIEGKRVQIMAGHTHAYSNDKNVALPMEQAQLMLDYALANRRADIVIFGGDLNLPMPQFLKLMTNNQQKLAAAGLSWKWSGDTTPTINKDNPYQKKGINKARGIREARLDYAVVIWDPNKVDGVDIDTRVDTQKFFADHATVRETISI